MKQLYILLSILFTLLSLHTAKAQSVDTIDGGTDDVLQVEDVYESTNGVYNMKSFVVNAPQAASYYMEMWILPSRLADDTFSPLHVYLNGAYVGTVNPTVGNWQPAILEHTETLGLQEGSNTLTVATAAPETPGVEAVKLSLNESSASFASEPYTIYLKDAIEGKEYEPNYEVEETATISTNSATADPIIYDFVDLKYSFHKTFSFTKDQEIFITSSSDVAHTIDVQYYSIYIPQVIALEPNASSLSYSRDSILPYPTKLNRYATSEEMQGLNWAGFSEKASNSDKQVATVKMTVPKTGLYLIRMRSAANRVLSVADLNVNGAYYYEDAPIYYSYVDCIIPADGNEYATMTKSSKFSTHNPMIFIQGGGGDRLVGYNNDCTAEEKEKYGLSAKDACISQTYFVPTERISVSSYSSSDPDSKCCIYARVAKEDASAAKTMKSEPSSTTDIKAIDTGKDLATSVTLQGNAIVVSSRSTINGITVCNLSGSTVAHFVGKEKTITIPTTSINNAVRGLYIVTVDTEDGITSRKLLVK